MHSFLKFRRGTTLEHWLKIGFIILCEDIVFHANILKWVLNLAKIGIYCPLTTLGTSKQFKNVEIFINKVKLRIIYLFY